ncbi:uncharacterized protein PV06_01089 [Exophiala oligosperma]|uniref:Uncharacterized protein n=1 Tax=Exophiala oligosperma TaxID=215243 RepID=A0A0D2CFB0_9EURO|nr:uncharacterized protein PV06_01089 [Exophiala oligosperma]KIW48512.1 hypothetical protein PV06_01089 [Exophiala oligosperma]
MCIHQVCTNHDIPKVLRISPCMTRIINAVGPPPWLTTTLESVAARNAWTYDSTGMTRGIHDAIVSRSAYYPPEAMTEPINGTWALEARRRHFTITNGLYRINDTASLANGTNNHDRTNTDDSHLVNGTLTPDRQGSNTPQNTPDQRNGDHNRNHLTRSLPSDTNIPPGNDNNIENRNRMNGIHQMDGSNQPENHRNSGNRNTPNGIDPNRREHQPENDYYPTNQTEEIPTDTHPFVPVGGLRLPRHGLRGRDFVMQAHEPTNVEARCRQTMMTQPWCFGEWFERQGPILFTQMPAITCNFVLCCDGLYRSHQGEVLRTRRGDLDEDRDVHVNGIAHD